MSSEPIDYGSGGAADEPSVSAPMLRSPAETDGPLVAYGMGGRIELLDGQLRIFKDGHFGFVLDLLWIANGVMEKWIPMSQVTSIEIVRPLVLPSFIRFSYAGSPPQTGHYLDDALAENALIMNLSDHRRFYEIHDRIYRPAASATIGASSERPT